MSIGSYYDVYTVDAYSQRVANLKSSIAELSSGGFFIEQKRKLEDQIDILKAKEQQIFATLKVKNIEELNQRLSEYRSAVINLSGPALYQNFIGILKENNALEFEAFSEAVMDIVQTDILNGRMFSEVGKEYVYSEIMNILNEGLTQGPGIDVTYRSSKGITNDGVFPASFTKEQKKRWEKLLKTKYKNRPSVQNFFEVQTKTSSKNTMSANFTWLGYTDWLTQSQAKELEKSQGEGNKINQINSQIKQMIVSKTGDAQLISQIVDYVLTENKYAFFVGKNEKEITGVLGEIQGLYYLAKFLGGNLTEAIKWRGGTFTGADNKKPHQDILLNGFGIQVKNSTKEIVDIVSFANASIKEMLNKAGISEEAKNVFLNYYGTEQFNVEYHWEESWAAPGIDLSEPRAADFVMEHKKLLSLADDVDTLLSLFAASFMYMDIAQGASDLDANILFLIGGTSFQTASNILSSILRKLDQEARNFNIKASLTLDRNIITAINNNKRGKDYSNLVLDNIKLTSSFNFNP